MRQEIPPSVGGEWEGPCVLLTRSVSISSSGGVAVRGDETSDETEERVQWWMRWRDCFKVTWSMPPVTVPECAELRAVLLY